MPNDEPKSRDWRADTGTSYDKIAEHYATEYFDELSRKPFDCELLTRFAQSLPAGARVCDIGCGPGHIARYLANRDLDATGVDLSATMVATAQRLSPELHFVHGDMLSLPFDDGWFAGVAAFYSLIHIERSLLPRAIAELYRVLAPEGRLLVTFHAGEGEIHRDEWFGKTVAVHVTLFTTAEMTKAMEQAGLRIAEVMERDPYEFEYQSRRAFITAFRPK
jgi:ubiquinone/menaquinone biosynthesis C-methylase UbiE